MNISKKLRCGLLAVAVALGAFAAQPAATAAADDSNDIYLIRQGWCNKNEGMTLVTDWINGSKGPKEWPTGGYGNALGHDIRCIGGKAVENFNPQTDNPYSLWDTWEKRAKIGVDRSGYGSCDHSQAMTSTCWLGQPTLNYMIRYNSVGDMSTGWQVNARQYTGKLTSGINFFWALVPGQGSNIISAPTVAIQYRSGQSNSAGTGPVMNPSVTTPKQSVNPATNKPKPSAQSSSKGGTTKGTNESKGTTQTNNGSGAGQAGTSQGANGNTASGQQAGNAPAAPAAAPTAPNASGAAVPTATNDPSAGGSPSADRVYPAETAQPLAATGEQPQSNANLLVWIGLGAVLLGATGFGGWYLGKGKTGKPSAS